MDYIYFASLSNKQDRTANSEIAYLLPKEWPLLFINWQTRQKTVCLGVCLGSAGPVCNGGGEFCKAVQWLTYRCPNWSESQLQWRWRGWQDHTSHIKQSEYRKGRPSTVVQVIVDVRGSFFFLYVTSPSSAHDARILKRLYIFLLLCYFFFCLLILTSL